MLAINKKLWRDLWHMKGQALAIALVIASGVATFIMSVSTLDSLRATQAAFYRDSRFSDVFATLKRAPESLKSRIEEIPGVQQVETRVVAGANLTLDARTDPASAAIVSLPDHGSPLMNELYLRNGRLPGGRDNEVVVTEPFADAHTFKPGDSFHATINGRRRRLEIVGVGLSPEYIYNLPPGSFIPDFAGYGVLWMSRKPLATAFDMDGAFNDAVIKLSAEAKEEDVIDRLDELLRRYGGLGAAGRKDQLSNRYLAEEFKQLENMATIFPAIFLGVAAFLLNVVVSRLIATQREQVAILKAFGYTTYDVVMHYLKFVAVIAFIGAIGGIAFGVWMGRGMSDMYMTFYRFPFLRYTLRPEVALTGIAITFAAVALGTVYAVIRAAMLPPAEAMQPAPPAKYRKTLLEKIGLARRLTQPTRMILRNIERRPVKSALSVLGVAMSCSILVGGGFFEDAVDYLTTVQFKLVQKDDMTVTFVEPTSAKAAYSLASVPGVRHVEPFRSVPARLRFQHRTYRSSILGLAPNSTMRRLLDEDLRDVALPADGVLMTDQLAKILGIKKGDTLTVEVLEGARPVRHVRVTGLIKEYVGVSAYMQLPEVNRMMREGNTISGAYITSDPEREEAIYAELRGMPRVAGTLVRKKALKNFYDTMAGQVLIFAFFNTLLAGTIAFGVVYNSARISLSERSRELASLRVLGLTRGEISYILIGEQALLTLAAIPLGFFIGFEQSRFTVERMQNDLFRIPVVVEPDTYAFSATVILVSFIASAWIVRRKLHQLDLVAVLKTRE